MENLTTGQRIAECRKKLGLSQEALGERVGVSRQSISKWEADAAMPEIDKLIALSKMFSVSVGWLLGVEVKPRPQEESPRISQELLQRMEELYKPRKKLPRWGRVLIGASAVLLLWGGIRLSREWISLRDQVSQLSSRINSARNDSAVLSRLDILEERIDGINDTIEREAALLADYGFQIHADPAAGSALVRLNAIPKTWNEEWQGALSVRCEGLEALSQTCAWDGSGLVAEVKLDVLDGYEYWLVISYPDGSREQVPLKDEAAEKLKSATSITCELRSGSMTGWDLKGRSIYLKGYDLHLAQPTTMEPSPWKRAEFVLYHIRDGEKTVADREDMSPVDEISITREYWTEYPRTMEIPAIEANDRLELWFEAELENGLTCAVKADGWVFRQGGFLLERW